AHACLKLDFLAQGVRGNMELSSQPPPGIPRKFKDLLRKDVLGAQVHHASERHVHFGAAPFAAPEMRLIEQGQELIMGVRFPDSGSSYTHISQLLRSLNGGELLGLAKEPGNFACVAKAGDALFLPAGHLYLPFRPTPVVGFRWACLPPWVGDYGRILKLVSSMLDSYPALAETKMKPRREFLVESAPPSQKGAMGGDQQ
ncbi:unnamed protein product, partial [Prorocentrum cordatum]